MNIATGQSAAKEHLANGSMTACNRKISTGKNDAAQFKVIAEKHPEKCCAKCLAKFKQKSN